MEWYVLMYDFNKNKIEKYNIFKNSDFNDAVKKELKSFTTFEDFKQKIERALMYSFKHKAEYEILTGGLFSKLEELEKIDVYTQAVLNLDNLCNYIIDKR